MISLSAGPRYSALVVLLCRRGLSFLNFSLEQLSLSLFLSIFFLFAWGNRNFGIRRADVIYYFMFIAHFMPFVSYNVKY